MFPSALQPDVQTTLILGSFWQKLGFWQALKPTSCCYYTGLKCFLEQGWTQAHTCMFCWRCFLKPRSLGDVLPVSPLSRPKFRVFISQIVSPRCQSSSVVSQPQHQCPWGGSVTPCRMEQTSYPGPWINAANNLHYSWKTGLSSRSLLPAAASAALLIGIVTNMHHNEKSAPSSSWTERIQTSPFCRKQVIHLSCWEERLTYVEHIVPWLVKL